MTLIITASRVATIGYIAAVWAFLIFVANKHGIRVAVKIRDPHAERSIEAQAERLRASADRQERAEREEAYAVAERFRKFRAENTRLMAAARSAL